jgi:aminoglycoside 3-N-acetyltransferase
LSLFVANFNNLTTFFAAILEEGDRLIPPPRDTPPVLVHASLSAFGNSIPGGEKPVLAALITACRKHKRTLVMPAHADPGSAHLTSRNPLLAFRRRAPCTGMGRIADRFRRTPGVQRSDHPLLSFCAAGPLQRQILRGHTPETGLGFDSPLGTLLDRDALILMLGTPWTSCTALHLAEYACAGDDRVSCWAPVGKHGRVWNDIPFRTEAFQALGSAFEHEHPDLVRSGPIPANKTTKATWKIVRMQSLFSFCVDRYPHFR